jgi:ApeA N-terminal domain 1/Apea-like HEPN
LKELHTEEFEYKGRWWLPDVPDTEIRGTLRLIPKEEAVLDLEGIFKDLDSKYITKEQDIILGITADDDYVTLVKCEPHGLSGDAQGLKASSYYANKVFKGVHFQKTQDIKFTSVYVKYSYLNEWVNITGFDMQPLPGEEIVIKYKTPEPIIVNINDDYKISLIVRAGHFTNYIGEREVSIKEKTYIMIETMKEKSFAEFKKIIRHVQNFLSLGVTEPVYPLTIDGLSQNGKIVNIYDLEININKTTHDLLTSDMLFTLKNIEDRFEELLRNWIRKADLLDSVYILYFSTLYNPHLYLEVQFLNLVHAIESYHNASTQAKYNKRKKKTVLKKRLIEVFENCFDVISSFIKDKEIFINKVVNTRHYLIHRNPKQKHMAAKEDELDDLTQKLKILIEICLLNELGFTLAEVKNLFLKNIK